MSVPKLPLDPHWVEQELTPYLRCAFCHDLAYDEDVWPAIMRAIDFTLKKAASTPLHNLLTRRSSHVQDYPSDGDDLVFERICQAIQFRYKNLGPDLSIVTENLEKLAIVLLRRAQLKGPYELLGRMNVASGAWREREVERLERLRLAAEKEKDDGPTVVLDPPPKVAPTEDQIDPRLVNALQGQYVAPSLRGTLSVVEDRYHRQMNAALAKQRQQQREAQQAAANAPSQYRDHGVPGTGNWQQHIHNPMPVQGPAPSYVQGWGQQQPPQLTQAMYGKSDFEQFGSISQPKPFGTPQQPYSPPARTQSCGGPGPQYSAQYAYHSSPAPLPQQQMRHYPVQPATMQAPWPGSGVHALPSALMSPAMPPANTVCHPHPQPTTILTADIAHLRGNQWTQAVEQRAHSFNLQSQVQANSHQAQAPPPEMSMHQLSNPTYPAGVFGRATTQSQLAQHPGYSNVTSAFPDVNAMYDWSLRHSRGPNNGDV